MSGAFKPYRVAACDPDTREFRGVVSPASLQMDDRDDARTVAQRYRDARKPDDKWTYAMVCVCRHGYIDYQRSDMLPMKGASHGCAFGCHELP
jgi:hypothetical protein